MGKSIIDKAGEKMSNQFKNEEYAHISSSMGIFYNTTEIPCILIDEEGVVLHSEGESRNYCNKLQDLAGDHTMCQYAHSQSSQQANTLGEAYISYCPAGLVHYTVALSSGQVFKGAIIAGPIHMSEPDEYEVDQVMKRLQIPTKEKGLLNTYYKSVPLISPSTARYQLELLTILAKDIMGDTKSQLQKKKAFYDEQRTINETIQELKEIEPLAAIQGSGYPIKLESDLASSIIKGDESSAKAILNELLGYIFFKHKGDNRKIIAMTMELVVIMSRAAVEGGARYEDVSKVTQDMFVLAVETEDIEAVCMWLMEVLEKIILFVFPIDVEKKEQMGVLRKAIIFMNQNLQEDISLDDVAGAINLSPTYFSRLFSNEMNMTYIEYLTMIRVEESKKYLVDTKHSISDIALRMGFSDQSYFSKVFKKVEGITPGKYRKMYL